MGDNKVDPKALKKTQDTLGKIIKKPPLTEKLLGKPPFRFLHDICTSVIKNTGFMKGLFTEVEMSSENVKDKDSKTAFLQKALDLVSLVVGRALSAKPSKIVAGHEPDKTNDFLQALAEAINKKVDNDDYVRRVLTGDKGGGTEKPPAEKPEKKPESKSKDRERSADRRKKEEKSKEGESERDRRHKGDRKEREGSRDRDRRAKERSRDREKEDEGKTKEDRHKEDRHKDREDRHKDREDRHKDREDRHKEDRHKDREDRHKDREDRHKDRERKKRRDDEDKENKEDGQMNGDVDGGENSGLPARIPRPSSAKGTRRRQLQGRRKAEDEDNEEPATDQAQMNGHLGEEDVPPQVAASRKMARPSSARPAPPRVKKNEPAQEEPVVVGSGTAPHIITDKTADSSDEEDDMFVTKAEEEELAPPPHTESRPQGDDGQEDQGDHGGLVKRIMETKAQLEHGSQSKEAQVTKKTEIDRSSQVTDVQRRKERELMRREIERVRASIQTLTRSVNPLGKILDFVQEDMDSMQKELDVWKKENRENGVALQREQSITDSSIEPLRAQLGELDIAVKDQLDLIAAVKSNILKNDDKITKMLSSVTKS